MPAFDALEARILNLSLRDASDNPEAVVVVGLFANKDALGAAIPPPDSHDGKYGQAGEPAAGGLYRRARVRFQPQASRADGSDARTTNVDAVTITGLPPGTYTHFGLFGSSSAGQA